MSHCRIETLRKIDFQGCIEGRSITLFKENCKRFLWTSISVDQLLGGESFLRMKVGMSKFLWKSLRFWNPRIVGCAVSVGLAAEIVVFSVTSTLFVMFSVVLGISLSSWDRRWWASVNFLAADELKISLGAVSISTPSGLLILLLKHLLLQLLVPPFQR